MGKARSSAERKRFKRLARGRPRLDGPREPNGRLLRGWQVEETERAATQVAVDARMRLYGLTEAMARQGEAGTEVGRMKLIGALSQDQYDASQRYLETVNAYQRAIGAKPDYTQPRDDGGGSVGTYEEFCRTARSNYEAMQHALRDLMIEVRSPAPVSALDVFVAKDVYMPELEGDLRLALNTLVKHFGISEYMERVA